MMAMELAISSMMIMVYTELLVTLIHTTLLVSMSIEISGKYENFHSKPQNCEHQKDTFWLWSFIFSVPWKKHLYN